VRLDKWLWAVRLFKTRTAASTSCRNGHVQVNGHPAKPSRDIRPGDLVTARTEAGQRTYRLLTCLDRRLAASALVDHITDLTPPEEKVTRPRSPDDIGLLRMRGTGRPTKKERRQFDAWWGQPPPG
jgi:ribosome-associated heat shock protein Hsp15